MNQFQSIIKLFLLFDLLFTLKKHERLNFEIFPYFEGEKIDVIRFDDVTEFDDFNPVFKAETQIVSQNCTTDTELFSVSCSDVKFDVRLKVYSVMLIIPIYDKVLPRPFISQVMDTLFQSIVPNGSGAWIPALTSYLTPLSQRTEMEFVFPANSIHVKHERWIDYRSR